MLVPCVDSISKVVLALEASGVDVRECTAVTCEWLLVANTLVWLVVVVVAVVGCLLESAMTNTGISCNKLVGHPRYGGEPSTRAQLWKPSWRWIRSIGVVES